MTRPKTYGEFANESDIVSEMKDFLAGELEPRLEELYGSSGIIGG